MEINHNLGSKEFTLLCPKCKQQVRYTWNQLGTIIQCPWCFTNIELGDGAKKDLENLIR